MWYENLTLVKQFGEALSNAEYFEDISEFKSFLRKPQSFDEAYSVWESAGSPIDDTDDGWDEFVDGISDDEGATSDNDG